MEAQCLILTLCVFSAIPSELVVLNAWMNESPDYAEVCLGFRSHKLWFNSSLIFMLFLFAHLKGVEFVAYT